MRYVILLISLMAFSAARGQDADSFYKHMEGQINNNIYLVADLICTGQTIKGTYYYFYGVEEAGENAVHYGKTMPLAGTLGPDNTLTFTEFELDGDKAAYYGKLIEGKRIEGTWKDAAGARELPFVLVEKYPAGSIPFQVYYHKSSYPLLDSDPSPVATLEQTMLLPVHEMDPAVNDSVIKTIRKCFFGKNITEGTPEAMMKQEEDIFFKNYRNANTDIYDGGSSFAWEKEKIINIHFNQDHFLTLECYDYGYTGGAHGLPMSKFIVHDLHDGHRVTLDEIFRPDYENDLRDLINSQLRQAYHLAPGTPLKEAGFFVQELDLTSNFYLNKDGIGFYYNRYEVAPYAMGSTDVFIPLRKLERFLDPDSPLRRLVKED